MKSCVLEIISYLVMCENFKKVLVHVVVYYVITLGFQSCIYADGSAECLILTDKTTQHHFQAFEIEPSVNKFVQGCATNGSVLKTNKTYGENFLLNVQNDRAADIYLNINGIHHRTTNTLPHYKEYKYEFALFSKKDVIWLVSTENMPNSSRPIHFKFYISPGSLIIPQNKLDFSSVIVEYDYTSSQGLLGWCITEGIFAGQNVTSFSEFSTEKVASVNIMTGFGQSALKEGQSSFTRCRVVQNDYVSPIISYQKYKSRSSDFACERNKTLLKSVINNRAFILDMNAEKTNEDGILKKPVRLEIVGDEETAKFDGSTVVVLRSNASMHWKIRVLDNLRSKEYLFVMGMHDTLDFLDPLSNAKILSQNLDYDENDLNVLTQTIETLYDSTVISHAKFDSPTDLIFLTLSDKVEYSSNNLHLSETDESNIARDIYMQSENICDESTWFLIVPRSVLQQYGMSEENLILGDDKTCLPSIFEHNEVEYTLKECSSDIQDGSLESKMRVVFNSQSDHFYSVFGRNTQTTDSFPLVCKPSKIKNNGIDRDTVDNLKTSYTSGIALLNATMMPTMSCTDKKFTVTIPELSTKIFDLSAIAYCKGISFGGNLEYTMINNEKNNCGAVFKDRSCRLQLPIQGDFAAGGNDQREYEFSCRDSTMAESVDYRLDVFQDFNMKNQILFSKTLNLNSEQLKANADAATFHVQVTVDSADPSLTSYLSECFLMLNNSATKRTLIRNNCQADDSVSFVKYFDTSSKRHRQHFVVQMDKFLQQKYENFIIKCEVSTCTTDPQENCVPTLPQCFHLHGDGCRRTSHQSLLNIATFHKKSLESGKFRLSEKNAVQESQKSTDVESSPESGLLSIPVIVILFVSAFLIGVTFICGFWWIDRKSYTHPKSPRTCNNRTESDTSGESGRSRSTGSTKTTGGSLSSLLCYRNRKESTSHHSSKDDLELKSLICPPQSPTSQTQPQKNGIRAMNPDPDYNMKPFTQDDRLIRGNGTYEGCSMNFTVVEGTLMNGVTPSSAIHPQIQTSSTFPTMLTKEPCRALSQKVAIVHISHRPIDPPTSCHTLQSMNGNGHLHQHSSPTSGSCKPHCMWQNGASRTLLTTNAKNDFDINGNGALLSKDEFDNLKEVDL